MDYTAENLRRVMARLGLSRREVAQRSGLDLRTLRGLLRGGKRPRPDTIHRLAQGLGVAVEEFFLAPAQWACQAFDGQTNPLVDELVAEHSELFAGWTEAEFAELASRFGHGGMLTAEGALAAARAMNRRRELIEKVVVLLETSQAETLAGIIELLYRQVDVAPDLDP